MSHSFGSLFERSSADRSVPFGRLVVVSLAVIAMLAALLPANSAYALPAPQDPTTEAIINLEADGLAPFDSATFDPGTGANSGQDADGANGVVRNFDSVTYNVETSLNDADDTNLVATVTLNDKASWAAVPAECQTVANGFAVVPDSSITDTTGDGLFDTMVCNLGDHNEGTKVLFKPVATATGNNADLIQASVLSSSDNNANASGLGGTQGDGPIETMITAGFGLNVTKMPCGYAEQTERPSEADCNLLILEEDGLASGAPKLTLLPWHVTLGYNAGSEFVADNGSGTQDFTITDTWVGTHSNDPSVEGDNANGDFDDQIHLAGFYTGVPADSCDFASPIAGASVACTQAGPGEPITIQVTGVPVNQQPLAEVVLTMAVAHPDVFDPNGLTVESYDINNTATLTGWGGAGTLVTSGSGSVDPGPHTATEDFAVPTNPPGPLAYYKSFDGLGPGKSGQRAAAPGDIVETTLTVSDQRKYDAIVGICDTIDTSVFEFAGFLSAGQIDAQNHGDATIWGNINGVLGSLHANYNPMVRTGQNGNPANGIVHDAAPLGVTVDFSDVDYATTGDDHWDATCQDDLTGNGQSDWVADPATLPGGVSSVVRVRVNWDRDYSQLLALQPDQSGASVYFSFDLKVKLTAPVGDRLPNTAATRNVDGGPWTGPDWWLGTTVVSPGSGAYSNVIDDPANPLYSFQTTNADRVLVVPASMSITKDNNPLSPGPMVAGDIASFTIDPSVVGSGPADQTMTFTDTLPAYLSYVGDDCAAAYAAVGLTCATAINPSGQIITWTVGGYTIGDELPPFILDTEVVAGTPSGTHINKVTIDSTYALLTDDSHCADSVDVRGNPNVAKCEAVFSAPHTDRASIQVLGESGIEVVKADVLEITEPLSTYSASLSYVNLGSSDIGVGQIIDILPYNGDGVLAANYSPERFNSENLTNVNTSTQTADPDGAVDFVAVTASSAGETFEYTTDPHATVDHRPCHPDNWPAGDDEVSNATIALVCERGLIDPATDVPTAGQAGTGATTWGALPADPADVTAVRASTPAFPAGELPRELLLEMNTAYAIEGDLYCNNFGANADIITLDIISNDVCVEVVAGSIGDFVWHDENSDGVQDGSEDPIPGVDIKLLVEDPANPGTFIPFQVPDPANPGSFIDYVVTTDADGGYLFENLPSGNYQVMVDPSTLPLDAQQTFDDNGPLDHSSDVSLFGPNNPETPDSVYTDVDDNLDQDFGYVFPEVDLALAKTTTATSVFAGQDVTFTIAVTNQGDVDMAFANVADYVPAGYTLSAADANGWTTDGTTPATAGTNGTFYNTVTGPITAGASATVDIVLTVVPGAAAADLVNVGEITGMEDTEGRDRAGDDVDSTPDSDPANDAGGTVGTPEDDHIDDDGVDGNGDGIVDEDDADPATVVLALPEAAIDIEKDTNGVQSDESPGETIPFGDPITWTFVVTNTGTTALADATVTDSQGVAVDCGDGTNVIAMLLPGDTVTCTGTGTAQAGPYMNNSDVTGDPVVPDLSSCGCDPTDPTTWPTNPDDYTPALGADGEPLAPVTDEDPSNYTGEAPEPGIEIEKDTNGADSDEAPGETIVAGSPVTWTYEVTNTGGTALTNVTVTDDQGVTVDCGSGSNVIALLVPGDSVTCTGTGTAQAGPYANNSTVEGDPVMPDFDTCDCDPTDPTTWPTDAGDYDPAIGSDGEPLGPVDDEDPSNYTGEPASNNSLGDHVWYDANGDGVQDPDETPADGITVNLYDDQGNLVATTTTDADGFYEFTGLADGVYNVEFVAPAGYGFTGQDQSSDDAADSDADPFGMSGPIDLDSAGESDEGVNDPTIDAGLVEQPGNSLGDHVWYDANGDGVQDPDETPADGVTVNLYDDQGNLVATTTTDADGYYEFTDLPDGMYQVEFVAPAGYGFTGQDQGSDDAADSDADPFGMSPMIDLDSAGESDEGVNDSTIDAGLVPAQGLGGIVWFDTNKDGVQDADEVVVPGVLVELLDADGNPVLDSAGNPVTAVTDENGAYYFPVAPGTYTVKFSPGSEAVFSEGTGSDNDLIDFLNGFTATYEVGSGEQVLGIDAPLIPNTLAFTGTGSGTLAGIAFTLTLAGAAALTLSRRRKITLN